MRFHGSDGCDAFGRTSAVMIFSSSQIKLIVTGRKTQERIPIRPGEERCRYATGHVYVCQNGWGQPPQARIRILATAQQFLADMTEQDAKREGYESLNDFRENWPHGDPRPERPVWIIVFTLESDEPRLLMPTSRGDAHHERGYTTNPQQAMSDEPEAVDDHQLREFAHTAQMRQDERWRADLRVSRERIAVELAQMRGRLLSADAGANGTLRVVTELERKLSLLDRQLA